MAAFFAALRMFHFATTIVTLFHQCYIAPVSTTPEHMRIAAKILAEGGTLNKAADRSGVTRQTISRWKRDSEVFKELVEHYKNGLAEAETEATAAIVRAAKVRAEAITSVAVAPFDGESEYRKRLKGSELAWYDTIRQIGMSEALRDSAVTLFAKLSHQMTEPDTNKRFFQDVIELAAEYVAQEDTPYTSDHVEQLQARLAPSPAELANGLDRINKVYKQSLALVHGERLQTQQKVLLGIVQQVLSGAYNVPQLQQICRAAMVDFAEAAGNIEAIAERG